MQELSEHLRSILLPPSFVSIPIAEDGYVSLRQQSGLSGEGEISAQTSENWRSKAIRRKLSTLKELVLYVGGLPTNLEKSDYVKRLSVFSSKRDDACIGPIFPDHGCLFVSFTSGMTAACMLKSLHERKIFGRTLILMFLPFISLPPTPPIGTYDPLLVFINSKSGGGQGKQVLEMMKPVLNRNQVFLLELGGPMPGLYAFRKLPHFRILVCGGDGTAGWVLSALEQLHRHITCKNPPIAVLPLGTGNDLARVLGFGSGWSGDGVTSILSQVQEALPVEMDRWTILFDSSPQARPSRSKQSDNVATEKHIAKVEKPENSKRKQSINGHKPLQRSYKYDAHRSMVNIVMGVGDNVGWQTSDKFNSSPVDEDDSDVASANILTKKLSNGIDETNKESHFEEDDDSESSRTMLKRNAYNTLIKKLSNGDTSDNKTTHLIDESNAQELRNVANILTKKLSNGHSEDANDKNVLSKKLSNGDADARSHDHEDDSMSDKSVPLPNLNQLEKKLSNGDNTTVTVIDDNVNLTTDSKNEHNKLSRKISNGESHSGTIDKDILLEANKSVLTKKLSNGNSTLPQTEDSNTVTVPSNAAFDNVEDSVEIHDTFEEYEGNLPNKKIVEVDDSGMLSRQSDVNVSSKEENSHVTENRRKSAHRKLHVLSSSDILGDSDTSFGPFRQLSQVSRCESIESDDSLAMAENASSMPDIVLKQSAADDFVNEILQSELPDIINDKQKLITLLASNNVDSELDEIIRKSISQEDYENMLAAEDSDKFPEASSQGNSLLNTSVSGAFYHFEKGNDQISGRQRSFSAIGDRDGEVSRRREYKKKMSLPLIKEDHRLKASESRLCQLPEVDSDEAYTEKNVGPKVVTMNNYLGMGIDAEISLAFHLAREENPEKFSSRLHNKAVYLKAGLKKMASRSTQLNHIVDLEVDGKEIGLPSIKGLIFLNISSWGAGGNAWGSSVSRRFQNPSFGDGLLEVVGVGGVAHMSQMYSGIRNGFRIAQGEYIRLHLHNEVAVQVDGEPWMQQPGQIIMTVSALQVMMLKRQKKKAK